MIPTGREGTGTRRWGDDREVGRGERAKPITLESGPEGVSLCPSQGGVWWGQGGHRGRAKWDPMPHLLPSLKLECEKLASEKTEMQRHYVMVRGSSLPGLGSGEGGLSRE